MRFTKSPNKKRSALFWALSMLLKYCRFTNLFHRAIGLPVKKRKKCEGTRSVDERLWAKVSSLSKRPDALGLFYIPATGKKNILSDDPGGAHSLRASRDIISILLGCTRPHGRPSAGRSFQQQTALESPTEYCQVAPKLSLSLPAPPTHRPPTRLIYFFLAANIVTCA